MNSKLGKTNALISYITIIGFLISWSRHSDNPNPLSSFHLKQAFGVHLFYHASSYLLNFYTFLIPFYILYVIYLGALIFGIVSVRKKQKSKLPLLGDYFQKWFTFIK
ncbi:MAG: hypothetical protein CMC18_02485 [Flavobacteriaceae bacterium]|nr:hypothetical protein [Flavobacteriaceae bacterium]